MFISIRSIGVSVDHQIRDCLRLILIPILVRDSGKQFGITTRLGDFCDRFERENQGSLNTLTGDDDVDVDADA